MENKRSGDMRRETMDIGEYGIWRYEKRDHGYWRIGDLEI